MEQSERDPEGEKTPEKTHKKERIHNQQLNDGSPNPSQPHHTTQPLKNNQPEDSLGNHTLGPPE